MFEKILKVSAKTDSIIKKVLIYGAAIGMMISAIAWTRNFGNAYVDPLVATEKEVKEIIDKEPLAQKDDVWHVLNTMVDEQIGDAKEEIEYIEDKQDLNKASPQEIRKKERLEKDVKRFEKNYLPEQKHSHEWQEN